MKLRQTILMTLLGAMPVAGMAQRHVPVTAPEKLFEEGKQLFIKKDYPAALRALSDYLKTGHHSYLMECETDYMLACAAYELKEQNRIEVLEAYLEEHTDSPYKNRVNALIANAYFYQNDYKNAISRFRLCDLDLLGNEERDEMTLHLAMAYIKTGNMDEAYALLSVVEACTPKYRSDVTFYKAYIDYAQKRYTQALPLFVSLEGDRKYGEEAGVYAADIYLIQGEYDLALRKASEYLRTNNNGSHALEMQRILGGACYGKWQFDKAQTALETYVNGTANPERNALYQLGFCYFRAQAWMRAGETLGRVTVQRDALAQNAYLHMGLAFLKLSDKRQAQMAFEQASTMDFDKAVKEEALYNYALCIHETSYSPFAESVTVFERFLNEFPHSTYSEKVNDYLIEVYMNTRSYEAALRSISKISQPGPRILEGKQKILFRLGTQAFANADFNKAIDYLNQSIQLGGYNLQTKADACYWRGESNYRLGYYKQAGNDYTSYLSQTQVRNDGTYGLAMYNLAYSYFKQKQYASAGTWFERFVSSSQSASNRQMLADAYNRLGDCRFHNRQFASAQTCYAKASSLDASSAEYALYQQGFVKGLQKDYAGKVADLNKLIATYPESQYVDEALYERGRAYVEMQNNAQAIASFSELVNKYPQSNVARKAAGEIGLLYYQGDNYDEAIKAYKRVIENYPGSEEAHQAQRDLRSVYIDMNRVDEYAQYASTIKGGISFDSGERDSLTYVAAEKVYMRNDLAGAKTSFARYLQQFPQGAFALNAHYYLGLIAYNQKDYTTARQHLDKVIEYPNNEYSEEAMVMSSEMAFEAKEYSKALALFKMLKEKTASTERRQMAQTGILRCAYLTNNQEEVVLIANEMLADSKLNPELANEARYYRAKIALNVSPSQAVKDLQVLSQDTRNVYGAEAKYRLAQYYFDSGNTEAAEKELLNYIDVSTPHAYWLARSFVLLSDVYAKLGRTLEARQYLLSLKQNYQADDDIASMIESRLETLK